MRNIHAKSTMRSNTALAVASTSALAAGMAQGAVLYTQQNLVYPLPSVPASTPFDITGDGTNDFSLGFDGIDTANAQKPYIQGMATTSTVSTAVLGRTSTKSGQFGPWEPGLPVTPFGGMIDGSSLTPIFTARAYLDQDGNANYVGDWPSNARTDGYVGVEVVDTASSTTNFGWLHLIYDGTASPASLTLVDSGYETTPGEGIEAGATNELGAPVFYKLPTPQTVFWGSTLQLQSLALGAPPPVFQWRARAVGSGAFTNLTDAGVFSGTTTSNLTINGASAATMLDYTVVVSNSLGAVTSSPPATLTVVSPAATPSPQVLFPGVAARFNVSVAPGLNPTYVWRKSGSNLSDSGRISGSSTAHLQVSNVQAGDAASYDVVLTSGSLVVTSSVATLAILPAASESTYESALVAAGPWAYYRLDETGDPSSGSVVAWDNAGGYNGVYGTNVSNGFTGVAGPRASDGYPGFASTNTAASFSEYTPYCWIPLPPWNLNTDTATMLAWINPADNQLSLGGVLFTGTDNPTSAGIRYFYQYNSATHYFDIGYAWNDVTTSCVFWDSQILPPIGQWSMVAAVIQPRSGTIYVFNTNGINIATNDGTTTFAPFNPFTNQVMPFAQAEYIGTDHEDTSGARNFYGAIDEVAVFKRALSQNDLQTIYNAALGIAPVKLQIALVGGNVQVTWPTGHLLESTAVNGPWTTNSLAVSPYTVPPTNQSRFYRVRVQ